MRLTHESPRTRWFILLGVWAVVALLEVRYTRAVRDYIALIDSAAQRAPDSATPLRRACPSNFMDAQMWTRYALALQEGAPGQVRFTDTDNAPAGREVHWDSGLAHALALAGRLEHARTGAPLPRATENALAWFNLPVFVGLVILFSAVAAQWAGAGAGVVVALGMEGSHDFYGGFVPNYVDHHGLLSAAVLGIVLGALFMGGGWWRRNTTDADGATNVDLLPDSREHARRGAIFSAVCGAIGMWISAATVIPAIVITGAAAVLAVWWGERAARAGGAEFDANLWRLWGRVGAALSVGFYLLEYAPSHLGWRLEVNHPLHALAWWGGAEFVAWLCEWRLAAAGARPSPRRLVLPFLALSAAPVTILIGGLRVFVASDPFVAQLSTSVAEGASQLQALRYYGWVEFRTHFNTQLVPLLLGVVLLARGRAAGRILLQFGVIAVVIFVAMSCWKIRYWLSAGGPLIGLMLVSLAALLRDVGARWRWALVLVAAAACYLPDSFDRFAKLQANLAKRGVQPVDFVQPLYRDVAAALRASQPQGDIVLLTNPNASSGIGYYGRFKTLGTLYWENTAGLRAAAEIFSATTDAEAFALIRAHGVTHLAMISEQHFLAEFFALLHPEAPPEDWKKTFGYRLLFEYRLPLWLRAIPYRAPADVLIPNLVVRLFAVAPEQTVAEAYWHLGEAELALGEAADGAAKLELAIAELAPDSRLAQRVTAGDACYQFGAHAEAVRFYRAVLEVRDDPGVARSLAWVLATSRVDAVRNGREALAIVEKLAPQFPNDHSFDSLTAATLAETGRFADAVALAERALARSRTAGEKTAEALNERRLAAYRAGKAWRQ